MIDSALAVQLNGFGSALCLSRAYYLAQVASGLDDYYTGHGEVAGRWVGGGSEALGLAGEVDPEDLRAVLAGLAPGTGLTPNGELLRAHPRRVPGFDLTFSVPKSVSVVYALGDPLVRSEVVAAGEAALAETLAWLEREACHVRRGTNNRSAHVTDPARWGTRRLVGAGFVAAAFRHRSSRAGDPQLHWHVLVANLSRGPDLRWSALDATSLYRAKRAAGVAFEAVLRAELTRRLGVSWLPAVKDSADIAGVPAPVLRLFSKRRQQIEAELARTGASGPQAQDRATLATRTPRPGADAAGLERSWHAQAEAIGWGVDRLDALLAHTTPAGPAPAGPDLDQPGLDELGAAVAGRLAGSDSTFTAHDITQAVAGLLPAGAPAARLDELTAAVIARPEIVPLPAPTAGVAATGGGLAGWERRFTTRALLEVEAALLAAIAHRPAHPVGALDAARIAAAVHAAPSLGADQRQAVERLLSQGRPVEVLVGHPRGAGVARLRAPRGPTQPEDRARAGPEVVSPYAPPTTWPRASTSPQRPSSATGGGRPSRRWWPARSPSAARPTNGCGSPWPGRPTRPCSPSPARVAAPPRSWCWWTWPPLSRMSLSSPLPPGSGRW
jgi:conjugative relaxase-like TrwC/TraI family protein